MRRLISRVSSRIRRRSSAVSYKDRINHWKLVKGDTVVIISGKDKGKSGQISQVNKRANRVFVTGLKMVKKHIRPQEGQSDTIMNRESPIHYSNVALIDPSTQRPARVKFEKRPDPKRPGKHINVRVSVQSGMVIEKPPPDLSYQQQWATNPAFDTDPEIVRKVTFTAEPGVSPFPSEVFRELGERRYWRNRGGSGIRRQVMHSLYGLRPIELEKVEAPKPLPLILRMQGRMQKKSTKPVIPVPTPVYAKDAGIA
ncbi:ribosomal protein L24 [Ramicandelaber brevisporus]|nr:ribosomal protein L24 [Ramicandelaber brevisporus]